MEGRRVTLNREAFPHMCKPSYSPREAAEATGLAKMHIDEAIRSGELEARMVGDQAIILSGALKRWLKTQRVLVPSTSRGRIRRRDDVLH